MPSAVKHVLKKLVRQNCIGGKHTAIEHCYSGWPTHDRKQIKQAASRLIKQGILRAKHTHYGVQVSIEPEKIPEVKRILGIGL